MVKLSSFVCISLKFNASGAVAEVKIIDHVMLRSYAPSALFSEYAYAGIFLSVFFSFIAMSESHKSSSMKRHRSLSRSESDCRRRKKESKRNCSESEKWTKKNAKVRNVALSERVRTIEPQCKQPLTLLNKLRANLIGRFAFRNFTTNNQQRLAPEARPSAKFSLKAGPDKQVLAPPIISLEPSALVKHFWQQRQTVTQGFTILNII